MVTSPAAKIAGSLVRPKASTTTPLSTASPASRASSSFGAAPIPITARSAREGPPVGADHTLHAAIAFERRDGGIGHDLDAVPGMLGGKEGGHRRRHDPVHHALQRFDHDDCAAELAQARGDLEADVAAADDHRLRAGQDGGLDPIRIGKRAQIQRPAQIDARHAQPPRPSAGAERERVVAEPGAVCTDHRPLLTQDASHARAEAQIDIVLLVVGLGPEPGPLERHLAAQVPLGQRRPLIRQVRFLAEQGNLAGEAQLAQAHGDLRAGLPGADDDHALRHRRDVARPGAGCNLGGMFE